MTTLTAKLNQFDHVLNQFAPDVANRLQLGLTFTDIERKISKFSWSFPQDGYALYQWHNGLSSQPGNLNLIEKLLRQKGKWHGELSGRENELRLSNRERLITAKFLPLDYALAGHRHLKLGRCLLELLPIFLLDDGKKMQYFLLRLDVEPSIVYCADGTKLPPRGVTEEFLSTQVQLGLADLISILSTCCQQQAITPTVKRPLEADYDLNLEKFEQIYQLLRK